MNNNYNFDTQEEECIKNFDNAFRQEIDLISRLFIHFEGLILQINKKIKDTDYPDWTIEIFLGYNLTLLYSSYNNLRRGYLGVSQSLIRPTCENVALSMYFFEFPKDEKKYRKSRKSFYLKLKELGYDSWIEGVLQRIDKEGAKFAKTDASKGQSWYKFLFTNLADEASNFLHSNPDYIFPVIFSKHGTEQDEYILGPNWHAEIIAKNALWKIIETTLFNTIIFDRVFKQHIQHNDFSLITEVVNKLNNWKKEYSEQIND